MEVSMDSVIEFGLISDDPIFASIMSSYFNVDHKYFPIFSLPRMIRNDWEIEVVKRGIAVKRSMIKLLFCKESDYALLAPLRSFLGMELLALKEPFEVTSIIDVDLPKETINVNKKYYIEGLLEAKITHKMLNISNEVDQSDFSVKCQRKFEGWVGAALAGFDPEIDFSELTCSAGLLGHGFVAGIIDKGPELPDGYFRFADVEAVINRDFVDGPFVAVACVRAHIECAGPNSDEFEFGPGYFNNGFGRRTWRSGMDQSQCEC